jgi:glycosyltransferase involved in cell wall biosynthesis
MGYNTKKLLFAINKIVQMLVDCFVYNKLLFKWLLYIGEIVEKKKRRRDKQNISVAITHFNRDNILYKSLFNILFDNMVSEIVILDDGSDDKSFEKLKKELKKINCKKIKLFRRGDNIGVLKTKIEVISLCSNNWVILLDSDNTITKRYLKTLKKMSEWDEKKIYTPEIAWPYFILTSLTKELVSFDSVRNHNTNTMYLLLNMGNYFLNKNPFLTIMHKYSKTKNGYVTSYDVMFANYIWLKEGNSIKCQKRMAYFHRVHTGSNWTKKNGDKKNQELLKRLSHNFKTKKKEDFSDLLETSSQNKTQIERII